MPCASATFVHPKNPYKILMLPEKRTLRSADRARWDEPAWGRPFSVDRQRTLDQLVESVDRFVVLGVDAAQSSLVSEVPRCI
jgi:hypothetical protein